MRLLIERVKSAKITIDNKETREISKGILVYVGISNEDLENIDLEKAAKKILNTYFFENEEGKLKNSILDLGLDILLVPNFSLYAKLKKGRTLSFDNSANYIKAEKIFYDYANVLKMCYNNITIGKFRSNMQIQMIADGPLNILLDI